MTPSTMRGITRGTCHHCGKFTDDGLVQSFRMCSHRCCDEHESLRADLLVIKRALKLAQAKGLRNRDWYAHCFSWRSSGEKRERARRLVLHWIKKFEREAGEMTCR
jgi:hypothetical protein